MRRAKGENDSRRLSIHRDRRDSRKNYSTVRKGEKLRQRNKVKRAAMGDWRPGRGKAQRIGQIPWGIFRGEKR